MKQTLAATHLSMGRETERILSWRASHPGERKRWKFQTLMPPFRLTVNEPEFFMRPADNRQPHFRLLRAQIKKGHRVLDNISIQMTGEETYHAN